MIHKCKPTIHRRRAFAKPLRVPRIGVRFGKLTVTDNLPRSVHEHRCIICLCDCGTKKVIVRIERLYSGNSETCGCGSHPSKHGHAATNSRTYQSYLHMLRRVEHHKSYKHVRTTPRWLGPHGFENFLADMGIRPPHKSLGRILDGSLYSKETAEWQSRKEQGAQRKARTAMKRFAAVYGHRVVKLS